jgi:ATP-dependent Clp protease ATP-binding subunit ClpC
MGAARVFEGYTEKARRVVFYGRYEASRFGSSIVETEHLLLGLMREDKALMIRLVSSPELLDSIRRQIEARTPIREEMTVVLPIPCEALEAPLPRSPVSFDSVRKLVEANPAFHERVAKGAKLPLSDECERVMKAVKDEADRLNHTSIRTEHLLLGFLREDECFAAELLNEHGVKLGAIREDLLNRLQ